MLKGKFTYVKTGRYYDAARGQASGGKVKQWCAMYGLQDSMRFAVGTFGEHGAIKMAQAWCDKMDYFHNIWMMQEDHAYKFSEEELLGWNIVDHVDCVNDFEKPDSLEVKKRVTELQNLQPRG